MADVKYEIKETVGTLSGSSKGWSKELNLISWNGREPKRPARLGTGSYQDGWGYPVSGRTEEAAGSAE